MISYCIVTNTEMRGHKDMADFDIAAFANMKLNYCHLAFNIFHLNISKTLHITSYTLPLTSGGAAIQPCGLKLPI